MVDMRELPNTPAADHDIAKDLSRVDRRERLKLHLKRALVASVVVATIGVGLWREWFADGTPRFAGTYVNDRLDGTETWFYANGNRELEVSHALGARHGDERWWHENGALRRVGAYVRGERDGTFTVYDEAG